ncbi:MAG TPA: O-antigen ligase family protein [Mycobacteriales bacterium]|nr:O-antigen ligase family protein [Mycobacteriales bacterium]
MVWAASPTRVAPLHNFLATSRRWLLLAIFVGLVFLFATGGPVVAGVLMGLAALAATISVASRHPQFAVVGIAAWLPLQVPVLAFLYKHGAPFILVKDLGYLKEFWAMSLVVAAVRASHRRKVKADLLDWLAAGYVGVATLYLILPFADSAALGGLPFGARLSAWRLDCLFVVVFLCIRRLSFDPIVIRRLRLAVFISGVILAGFALWESASNTGFNNFLRNTLDYPGYRSQVLHNQLAITSGTLLSTGSIGNTTYVRGGSLFNDPLVFGFFMVIPFGIALERVAARRPSLLAVAAAAGGLIGILLSITRGAVLASAFVVLFAMAFGISRVSPSRLRLVLTVFLAGVVLLPMAGSSSLLVRMETIFNPSKDTGTQNHVSRTYQGYVDLVSHPFGYGLGTNTTTATLYNGDTVVITENSYLETGDELGLPALVFYFGALMVLLAKLRQRSKRAGEGAGLAGAAWMTGWGLTLGAMVLETWYELPVALVFWTIAGLALADTGTAELPETAARRSDAPNAAVTAF